MLQNPQPPLREYLIGNGAFLRGARASVCLDQLIEGSSLDRPLSDFAGHSVLLATSDQLTAALALIELDGIARRIVLCLPDVPAEQIPSIIAHAQADAVVHGPEGMRAGAADILIQAGCSVHFKKARTPPLPTRETEWILLTSGTSGTPKLVVHTLASLRAAITTQREPQASIVWGTFYDIRRYGGLQIFLRAIFGGTSLVLSAADESMTDHLERLSRCGVTHLTGTPSHWRWALLNPAARALSPRYARLSGEIADQSILDSLREFYPAARSAHAFASTEAGVGFEVNDGLAGFPAGLIGQGSGRVELKIADRSLHIRSNGTARCYLGAHAPLKDDEGFVDTGDIVERRADRYYFVGRRGGIINVGGLKVHPEEIEAVINRHPEVRMSLVRGRKNSITGAIVVADVVLRERLEPAAPRSIALKQEILQTCRAQLAQHKVPAAIRFVPELDISSAGKTARSYA